MTGTIEKEAKKNWKILIFIALTLLFLVLCRMGTFEQYNIHCCWMDDPYCDQTETVTETVTIVEECGSCLESTFPNCAGECPGSTEQNPISCLPKINIVGGYTCQCQEVWNFA